MGTFRHNQPPPNKIEALERANPSAEACGRQKLAREVSEVKKDLRNCERREKRAREKLAETEVQVEDAEMIIQATSDENRTLHEELDDSTRRNTELKRQMKLLAAKFNSRVRREPQKITTSVKRALSGVFAAQETVYKVKTPDRTIQNWARNVILHLVCASDVPASKTWSAFCCVTEAMGITIDGSWSDRSARRVVLEGSLAAEEMIVEDFAEALGISMICRSPTCYIDTFVSVYTQWRWRNPQGHTLHVQMGNHGPSSGSQTKRPLSGHYTRTGPHCSYPG